MEKPQGVKFASYTCKERASGKPELNPSSLCLGPSLAAARLTMPTSLSPAAPGAGVSMGCARALPCHRPLLGSGVASQQVVTETRSWKGEAEPQGQAVFVYPGDGAHNSETKGQTPLPWEMVFEAASRPAGARMEWPQRLSCQVIFVILAGSEAGSGRFRDTLIQDQKGLKHLVRKAASPGALEADPHPTAPAARWTPTCSFSPNEAGAAPPNIPKGG